MLAIKLITLCTPLLLITACGDASRSADSKLPAVATSSVTETEKSKAIQSPPPLQTPPPTATIEKKSAPTAPPPSAINRQKPAGVHLNEILASNLKTNLDADYYQFSDWIELYNNSSTPVDIGNYYLSDKKDNPKMWRVPAQTVIPAQGYLLIWADKKDSKKKALHTNFKLSAKKERVIFSDKSGNIIDNITFTKQSPDISCAPSGNDIVYMTPSPAKADNTSFTSNGRNKAPTLSPASGFYDHTISVSLAQEEGADIYYTTDGSIPTLNSKRYTQAIMIEHNTIIKTIAKKGNDFPSPVTEKTYFINEQSHLPVVSLSIDDKFLFDDTIGIYTTGSNGTTMLTPCTGSGVDNSKPYNFFQDWKRPAHISYFDKDKKEAFSLDLDIAISGQCSRHYPKKAFKFKLDNKYASKSFTYRLYEHKGEMKLKDFKIRPGNKGYEIGDILASSLAKSGALHLDYQDYKAARLFVNGKYWGLYNIREKKGANFLKSNYPSIDTKKLDVIKNSAKGGKNAALVKDLTKEGNLKAYQILEKTISTNNYHNYAALSKIVDMDNLMDYLIIMIYSGNEDWSYSNARAWREQKEGAKWRWMLDDLDEGFIGYENDPKSGLYSDNLGGYGILNRQHEFYGLFQNILNDASAKAKFLARLEALLNTTLSPSHVKQQIDIILQQRESSLMLEAEQKDPGLRWFAEPNQDGHRYNSLKGSYLDYKARLYTFAAKRANVIRAQINIAKKANWTNNTQGSAYSAGSTVQVQTAGSTVSIPAKQQTPNIGGSYVYKGSTVTLPKK